MWHTRLDGIRSILLGRTFFVLVGVLWAVRSLQSFTEPNFTDPESASDWWAVVSVSLALALLPAGMVLLVGLSQPVNRTLGVLLVLAALGSATAAIANVVEGGLGVDAVGNVYYGSILLLLLTMLALAGVLVAGSPRWPGAAVLATLIGLILLESGGGVLILLVWGAAAIAVRPRTTP
jgi:hypothetical protein